MIVIHQNNADNSRTNTKNNITNTNKSKSDSRWNFKANMKGEINNPTLKNDKESNAIEQRLALTMSFDNPSTSTFSTSLEFNPNDIKKDNKITCKLPKIRNLEFKTEVRNLTKISMSVAKEKLEVFMNALEDKNQYGINIDILSELLSDPKNIKKITLSLFHDTSNYKNSSIYFNNCSVAFTVKVGFTEVKFTLQISLDENGQPTYKCTICINNTISITLSIDSIPKLMPDLFNGNFKNTIDIIKKIAIEIDAMKYIDKITSSTSKIQTVKCDNEISFYSSMNSNNIYDRVQQTSEQMGGI